MGCYFSLDLALGAQPVPLGAQPGAQPYTYNPDSSAYPSVQGARTSASSARTVEIPSSDHRGKMNGAKSVSSRPQQPANPASPVIREVFPGAGAPGASGASAGTTAAPRGAAPGAAKTSSSTAPAAGAPANPNPRPVAAPPKVSVSPSELILSPAWESATLDLGCAPADSTITVYSSFSKSQTEQPPFLISTYSLPEKNDPLWGDGNHVVLWVGYGPQSISLKPRAGSAANASDILIVEAVPAAAPAAAGGPRADQTGGPSVEAGGRAGEGSAVFVPVEVRRNRRSSGDIVERVAKVNLDPSTGKY